MKNRTRIILVLALVIMSLCLFAIVSSATEYEVSTDGEFETAYSSAVDGDTIVIKADITATLNFGKSITYIIDGGHTWKAGAQNTDTNKDVKIFARNGNGVFCPNASMWCNSYALTNTNLNQTTWSFGSLDDSILTLDLSLVSCRLFYGTYLKELNFGYGAHVTGCNNTKNDNTYYLYATTINIYEGAKIYGNYIQPYCGFMRTNTLNIYGGEIYGNYFNEYGMVVAINGTATVNMYGGEIHDTYLNFTNKDVTEGIFDEATLNMYDGKIYNNYVKGNNALRQSILAGAKHLVNGSVYNNYYVTGWTAPTLDANGLYSTVIDTTSATELGNGLGNTTLIDYSVIFKNSDSSVIDAFMIKDGAVTKSVSGLTAITVPSDITAWTNKANYCEAIELPSEFTTKATYYAKAEHKTTDDFDCTTVLACDVCKAVISEAKMAHDESIIIVYEAFTSAGSKTVTCKNEGCSHKVESTPSALISYLGVSAKIANGSICIGYALNLNEANEYINAGNTFRFGVVAYIPQNETDVDPIGSDLLPKDENYTISAELQADVNAFDFVISGFTGEAYSTDMIMCAYVYDGIDVDYISVANGEASQTELATIIKFNDYIQEVER